MKYLIVLLVSYIAVSTASLDNVIEKSIEGMMRNTMRGAMRLAEAQSPRDTRNFRRSFNGNAIQNKYSVKPIRMVVTGSPYMYPSYNRYPSSKKMMILPGFPQQFPPSPIAYMPFPRPSRKNINVNLRLSPPSDSIKNVRGQSMRMNSFDQERESKGELTASWTTEMKEVLINGKKNETRVKTFNNRGRIHALLGSERENHRRFVKGGALDAKSVKNSIFSKKNLFQHKKGKVPQAISVVNTVDPAVGPSRLPVSPTMEPANAPAVRDAMMRDFARMQRPLPLMTHSLVNAPSAPAYY